MEIRTIDHYNIMSSQIGNGLHKNWHVTRHYTDKSWDVVRTFNDKEDADKLFQELNETL